MGKLGKIMREINFFYEKTENIYINEHYDPFSGPKDHF